MENYAFWAVTRTFYVVDNNACGFSECLARPEKSCRFESLYTANRSIYNSSLGCDKNALARFAVLAPLSRLHQG